MKWEMLVINIKIYNPTVMKSLVIFLNILYLNILGIIK